MRSEGQEDDYMKTKKALAGLLGLLGSFAAFPFLVDAPTAFVEATRFLFTESLPSYTKSCDKMNKLTYNFTYK